MRVTVLVIMLMLADAVRMAISVTVAKFMVMRMSDYRAIRQRVGVCVAVIINQTVADPVRAGLGASTFLAHNI